MIINAQTKIGSILKERADALDVIISLSPKFEKLRNPLLRRVMAPRTSIAAASKIGGCEVLDFLKKLEPLGFETDSSILPEKTQEKQIPAFMLNLRKEQVTELDVRLVISSGKDPLSLIIQKKKLLKQGQVLKIVNSFYPEPLVLLLKKQGFESFVDIIGDELVETYFYKKEIVDAPVENSIIDTQQGWDQVLERYEDKLQQVDVRQLAMPLPMIAILDALDKLLDDHALFVYHKRVPVYLLSELTDRQFNYRIKEISKGNINLIIFKD